MTKQFKSDLAVVIPVYNEQDIIKEVVDSWILELEILRTSENLKYIIIVINDGSKDNTLNILNRNYGKNKKIVIIDKPNEGHGPSVLLGYHKGIDFANWVFQVDGDNEMHAKYFSGFWRKIKENKILDGVFAIRKNRKQTAIRKFMSYCSRLVARKIYLNFQIYDVNVPYRLMRSEVLLNCIKSIPYNTLTPNILISAYFSNYSCCSQIQVPHISRQTGTESICKFKLWKFAIKAFFQIIKYTWRN